MTKKDIEGIKYLRNEGLGWRSIAQKLSLPANSVKSWCRRHTPKNKTRDACPQCGGALVRKPRGRRRVFCSDACRTAWWSAHPEMRKAKKMYRHTCGACGKEFFSGRVLASYCGRACFALARKKDGDHG